LVIAVPLTSVARGWEIHIPVKLAGRTSYALCEQVRSVSVERLGAPLGQASHAELEEVRAMVRSLVS
jgi:mRNA-degrading endonuclease toxin of MazEF toxin-antitoxin module